MQVQNSRGTRIELGQAIKRGGEAQIFEVRDKPNLVAKIYHAHRYDERKQAKLKAMLANAPRQPATHTAIAWPIELLYERGRLVGFLMPKIEEYDPIINFYNPSRRKKRHSSFDWRYLHRTASNLAVVIETVHEAGHVIGDLNESNVLVNDRALVTLVDADSFQIVGPKGKIYRCPVGKPEYTPPELQGARFDQVNRRPEHDHFGLAVLVFQLLMEGYHPFSGVLPAHLSVGRVDVYGIKEGLFPYHQNPKRLSIQMPPNAPSFTLLHPDLQALFIRSFVDGHRSPTQRPTAHEWQAFLQRAEEALVTCERNPIHLYSNHLATCPFCPPEQAIQAIQKPLPPARQSVTAQTSTHIGQSSSLPPAHHRIFQTNPFQIGTQSSSTTPSRTTFMPSRPYGSTVRRQLLAFLANIPEGLWLLMVVAIVGGLIAVNLNLFNLTGSNTLSDPASQAVFFDSDSPDLTITAENADQIEQIGFLAKGRIEEAVVSKDGDLLALASSTGIYILDAETLEQVRLIDTGSWVSRVAFRPDGKTLAAGLRDGKVQLWSTEGHLIRALEGHRHAVKSVAFSPDGQMLASSSYKTVHLSSTDGTNLNTLSGHTDWVNSVAFSPDGQMLLSGSDDQTVRLWFINGYDGTLIWALEGHTDKVNSVAFSPDGSFMASGSDDRTVRLRSISGTLIKVLKGHKGRVSSVAFSPDSKTLASSSSNELRLWSTSGTLINTLSGHTNQVKSVAFDPDDKTLASVSYQKVRLWSTDGTLIRVLEGERHATTVNSVVFSPDRSFVAFASDDNGGQLWSMDGTLQATFSGRFVAFSPDSSFVVSALSNKVRLWSTDGTLITTLEGHSESVTSLAVSYDSKTLASASHDHNIRLWSTDGTQLALLEGHTDSVMSVAFSPDSETLASGSKDGTIRLWSTDGTFQRSLFGHTYWVRDVAFSPDGKTLASASDDKTVRLWSTNGTPIISLEGHTGNVSSVAFSPDGKTLASASWDKTVRLWSTDGTPLYTLSGHTSTVNDVAFSPDGKTLASASWDGTVRLWGVPP